MLKKLQKIQELLSECIAELSKSEQIKPSNKIEASNLIRKDLDFSLNIRAFMKKYGKDLSGPKKFTLLIAYIAEGDDKKIVKSEELSKELKSLKSFFNGKTKKNYSTRAKENGWINSPNRGGYVITKNWLDIIK